MLPVVTGVMMARLCELEGFTGGFMGGSGYPEQVKELKTTGKFVETAKMRLAPDINAKLIDQEGWRARAKKYGMM